LQSRSLIIKCIAFKKLSLIFSEQVLRAPAAPISLT
jgi:hypothetical protein